jgi:NAD(P)-dependent dehydrogenase (short-subunit alcohol dehydrogenase family)
MNIVTSERGTLAVPSKHLKDKVALVTGSTSGIGLGIARAMAAAGAAVVLNGFGKPEEITATQAAIGADFGVPVAYSAADMSKPESIAEMIKMTLDMFGRLDVLVNNAGILRDSFIAGMEESQWDAVIGVHLKGHFALLRHAAAYWKAQSKAGDQPNAAVINTASGSGTTLPNPGQANYGSAKAAIAALTLIAAEELERYGVRVNAIAPIARTRLTLATPGMGSLMSEPEDGELDLFSPANISPLVAYLATEKCPVTGRVYAVQGGAISRLSGWHDVETIETDGAWTIDDIAVRLPS